MGFRHRSLFAWIALLGIVFSQLVVSAYACPQWTAMRTPLEQPAHAGQHGDMAGMPCAGMADEPAGDQLLLCDQYSQQAYQVVGSSPAPDFQPMLVFLPSAAPRLQVATPVVPSLEAPLLVRATSPPPLLRSQRLRL